MLCTFQRFSRAGQVLTQSFLNLALSLTPYEPNGEQKSLDRAQVSRDHIGQQELEISHDHLWIEHASRVT